MRVVRPAVVAVALLLPGAMLAPAWRLSGLGAGEDDVLYYLPSRTLLREAILAGQWPFLNPWTGLDRPLLADPQTALFYPGTWLFAVFEPLTAYPLSLWLHYSLAFGGTYRLLRGQRLDRRAASIGALVFAFGGFMLAHRAHFAMQNAAAWTPWVFHALSRYADRGGVNRLATAAAFAALQAFAGHVQIAALTAAGSATWLVAQRGVEPRAALRWLMVWVCAAGLFAVQWMPTYAYVRECTRGDRGLSDFLENSWNPLSAATLLLPMLFGQRTPNLFDVPWWGPSHQCEQLAYVGVAPLVLAVAALRSGWAERRRWAWAALAAAALLVALGRYAPLAPLLYWIPGASLLRVPARALLLVDLALAALAAGAIHDLAARPSPGRARLRAAVIVLAGRPLLTAAVVAGAAAVAVAAAAPFLPARTRAAALATLAPWNLTIVVPAATILVSLTMVGRAARQWRRPGLLGWLAALISVDLGVVAWTLDVPARARSAADLLASGERESWIEHVRGRGGRLWVVTPRDSHWEPPGEYVDPLGKCSANANVLFGIASLSDYGPLQPRVFARVFPFKPWGEDPSAAERLTARDWRRPFDVRWLLMCAPGLPAPQGCETLVETPGGYRLLRNPDAEGPALFEDAATDGVVVYEESAPHRFTTRVATAPAAREATVRVVVSRLALRGWSATADGRALPIEPAFGALLSVEAPRGRSIEIEWRYAPPGLVEGAVVSLASVATLAGSTCAVAIAGLLRRRASGRGPYSPARRARPLRAHPRTTAR